MIEAVVFDAYGTLFDVHSVVDACDELFPQHGEKISNIWRQKQLEYTWLRALMGRYVGFDRVNRDAIEYTLDQLKLSHTADTLDTLVNAYESLRPFPEVPQALEAFRPRELAILSNGTPRMLQTLVQNTGLTSHFEKILSVDVLQTYKPNPIVYELAVSALGVAKKNILFVSSNGWDVAGSKSFGFTVAWINRQAKTPDNLDARPDYEVANLQELATFFS